jgi:hypothetical protein
MAINELNQSSLLDVESNLEVPESNIETPEFNQQETKSEEDPTRNLLVESINQTTNQTTKKPPKNISSANPMFRQVTSVPGYKSPNDFYAGMEQTLQKNPLYEEGHRAMTKLTPKKVVEKYDDQDYGYIYGMDNDDMYGKLESPWTTGFKAIPRLGLGIVNKLAMGVGYVSGLLNPVNWAESIYKGTNLIDTVSDTAIVRAFDYLEEETKNEWLPTFQEAADKKKGNNAKDEKEDKKTSKAPKGKLSKAQEKLPPALKKAIAQGVRD